MASIIKMPPSGQNAAESLIVCWHVKEGDDVNRGDVLFEIETDKATMNVESFAKGKVLKILYEEGDKVAANEPVAYIGKEGEAIPGMEAPAPAAAAADDDEDEYQPIMGDAPKAAPAPAPAPAAAPAAPAAKGGRPLASPKARAAAKENGADIKSLYEALGRPVRYADVAAAPAAPAAAAQDFELETPSNMRKVIARRMLESTSQVPQFTVSVDIDMTEMIDLRNRVNAALEKDGIKVSFNDLIAKAICAASKEIPYINASYTEEAIRINKYVNVGIAVALPAGLVVPVVKGADKMSLKEIAVKGKELIAAAKGGKLTEDMMSGGTITISNLGMYGISNFTAIVNRPEAAILAVGGIIDTPVGVNGEIVLRPMMNITASFDHRIIDGGVGAMFMAELKKAMEAPLGLLL